MSHVVSGRDVSVQRVVLSPGMHTLNERYLDCLRDRSLCPAATVDTWRSRMVDVFLRHDSDHVFAIASDAGIGMANCLVIEHAELRVDRAGRKQAVEKQGALPNGRNVHAVVTGRLLWAAMNGPIPDETLWHPVEYIPQQMTSFRLTRTGQPVRRASFVMFVPGRRKVWCLNPIEGSSEVSS